MGYKLFFTQTEHEPQVWGTMDCDWAERMRESYLAIGNAGDTLCGDPEEADIVVFWEPHQDSQVVWAPRLRYHPLVRAFPNKVFVVSVEDSPLGFLPGLYCSLPKPLFDRRRHRTWVFHRTPNPRAAAVAADDRSHVPNLLASFVGAPSHPLRDQLFERTEELMREGVRVRKTMRGRYSTDPGDPALEDERRCYVDAILDAKFSLCPRGNGVGAFRTQESMALGRAPVILADDWVPVEGPDWESFALFVPERDVGVLPEVLRRHESRWKAMGEAARATYDAFFAHGKFVSRAVAQIVDICRKRTHDERDCFSQWDAMIETERRRRGGYEVHCDFETQESAW